MKEVDLDQTHRLGAPKEDKVRAIIVKFIKYNTRSRVSKIKKKLKGRMVSVTESLRMMRMEAFKEHARSLKFIMFGSMTKKKCTPM